MTTVSRLGWVLCALPFAVYVEHARWRCSECLDLVAIVQIVNAGNRQRLKTSPTGWLEFGSHQHREKMHTVRGERILGIGAADVRSVEGRKPANGRRRER